MKKPGWLADHKADVFSQNGEDGIIAEILQRLPQKDGWCVEFGAWDGRYLSNCANLIDSGRYHAVMIEADPKKFRTLKQNYVKNPNVISLNNVIGFAHNDNLDTILSETPIPFDFDFMSIDIDGNDYHVWAASERYHPKVVCVEYNQTMPNDLEFVQAADPAVRHGSSLKSLVILGRQKGYELISVVNCNAFFVSSELFPRFDIDDNSVSSLRTDTGLFTYLCSGYDGTILLGGYQRLHWHGLDVDAAKLQVLPRWFRKYPPDLNRLESLLLRAFVRLNNGTRRIAAARPRGQ